MSTKLDFPKAIEDALRNLNPSTSRRSVLRSSGAVVLSLSVGAVPCFVQIPEKSLGGLVGAGIADVSPFFLIERMKKTIEFVSAVRGYVR